jgi:hypothetical protein
MRFSITSPCRKCGSNYVMDDSNICECCELMRVKKPYELQDASVQVTVGKVLPKAHKPKKFHIKPLRADVPRNRLTQVYRA